MGPAELRLRREALHLTQAALARTLGLSRNTVARWERGELQMEHAELLAIALDHLESRATGAADCRTRHEANNLPEELSSFVGRERELAELEELLRSTRLLTLVGVGGVGKTRLATRLANVCLREYRDGVWFVDLAPLVDPRFIERTVSAAVDFPEDRGESADARAVMALAQRRSLLVLDNCEHLLEDCAQFISNLLRSGKALHVLATSREPLGLTGERVFRVQPLPVLDPSKPLAPERFLELAAVKLMLQRATGRGALITPRDHTRALAEICWRLDGLPLALELAAARLTAIGPAQVARRLQDGFGVLSAGDRDAPRRHQTLRTTLDWSHALLSADEQRLFARVAVFAGGWTLEACQSVAGFDGLQPSRVLDLLSALVAKSLVVAEPGPAGTLRYRLLDTVRHYASERLDLSGERMMINARHSEWYLGWVDRISSTGRRPLRAAGVLISLDADLDNLRRALESATTDPQRIDRVVMAAGRLWWFWNDRGRALEGYERTRLLLRRAGDGVSAASRAQALLGAGLLAWHLRIDDDLQVARELLEQAVTIRRQLRGDGLAGFVGSLARVVRDQGDQRAAQRLLEEALNLAESCGDQQTVARSLHGLGTLLYERGEFEPAMARFERSLEVSRAIRDDIGVTTELAGLAITTYQLGDMHRTLVYTREVLALRRDLGARAQEPGGLSLVAGLAARHRQPEFAGRLYGAAGSLRQQVHAQGPGGWSVAVGKLIQRDLDRARLQLGPAAFAHAVAVGRTLSLEQAVAEALEVVEKLVSNAVHASTETRSLTQRETQVAALVARGMTNRQIATELVLSESTAAKHVEHIRDKLGFRSRAQIAAYSAGRH